MREFNNAADNDLVLAFQQAAITDNLSLDAHGADGIWGPETSKASTVPVKKGCVGARVKLIQSLLSDKLPEHGVDGVFGEETEAAVRAYQSRKTLAVNGVVALETWRSLLRV